VIQSFRDAALVDPHMLVVAVVTECGCYRTLAVYLDGGDLEGRWTDGPFCELCNSTDPQPLVKI